MMTRTREEQKWIQQNDPWRWRVIQLSGRTGIPEEEMIRLLGRLQQFHDGNSANLILLEVLADFVQMMIDRREGHEA
jgi:hypothetical protein